MSKRSFFSVQADLFFLAFFLCGVVSLSGSPSSCQERLIESKGPIVITSSTLNADNKAHTALFEGSVTAKTETMTIYADRMLVYSSEGGKITKIEAAGHVKLIKGERVITSEEATYFADEDKVVFSGQPKAVEGTNMVTGTKMIYLMQEDRSLVENSKVFMEKGASRGR
jgi:lipopolysaccharide export system protein LptA